MHHSFEPGFTLIKVAVAVVLLSLGILALAGGSATATRMIGRGRESTLAYGVAASRIEWLRQLAGSTWPPCLHPQFATGNALTQGISEEWTVPATGTTRQITVALRNPLHRLASYDSVLTVIACR
jgi:Tfp pilus assembly protein PilV